MAISIISSARSKRQKFFLSLVMGLLLSGNIVLANTIDIGIFQSPAAADRMDIRLRPGFSIAENQTITAILFALKWDDPAVSLGVEYIFPFFIAPQGAPVMWNGSIYQLFAAVPLNPAGMNANEEYVVSTLIRINGDCANFEIADDTWTQNNNGNVYIEFLGLDVTGIIYEPVLNYGSAGGIISGGTTIQLGESTGLLNLSDHHGFVNGWQKRWNGGSWSYISATAGVVTYAEVPSYTGEWEYRCVVQHEDCPETWSQSAVVTVLDTMTTTHTNGSPMNSEIEISTGNGSVFLRSPSNELLSGKLTIYNLMGQQVFQTHVSLVKFYSMEVSPTGPAIIIYSDDKTGKVFRKKIWID